MFYLNTKTSKKNLKVEFFLLQGPLKTRLPQMDLIAELKRRQVSSQVREEKDGAIEDIITGERTTLIKLLDPAAFKRFNCCYREQGGSFHRSDQAGPQPQLASCYG